MAERRNNPDALDKSFDADADWGPDGDSGGKIELDPWDQSEKQAVLQLFGDMDGGEDQALE